jgi:hypothetical protein
MDHTIERKKKRIMEEIAKLDKFLSLLKNRQNKRFKDNKYGERNTKLSKRHP